MSKKFNKYDIIEITWIDSHSGGGWHTAKGQKDFIEDAKTSFTIRTVGYYWHEDNDFIRVSQGYDQQSKRDGVEMNNLDAVFAIAKPCIKNIKLICQKKGNHK